MMTKHQCFQKTFEIIIIMIMVQEKIITKLKTMLELIQTFGSSSKKFKAKKQLILLNI